MCKEVCITFNKYFDIEEGYGTFTSELIGYLKSILSESS